MKLLCVVGARPNFMKLAPIVNLCGKTGRIDPYIVHTGQHYDQDMSTLFFEQLGLPEPDINLEVGSGSHAWQTAAIMQRFEPVLARVAPDAVLVVGDVNSTIACGLVAVKSGLPVVHVEAGLRSFDRSMPEEINRILTDAISDILFCTEQSGIDNLSREGVDQDRIFLVGNVMIDTLLQHKQTAMASTILDQLAVSPGAYALLTLHRPSNVDNSNTLDAILAALDSIQKSMKVVFPMHPRTKNNLQSNGRMSTLQRMENMIITKPLGYLDFIRLISCASLVLTDSGGIQEETTILNIPCLTLRKNTERPITISMGTNQLVGNTFSGILQGFHNALGAPAKERPSPPLWDGKAAERICAILINAYA